MPTISITQEEYDVILEGFEACESCNSDDAYVNHVNATKKHRDSFRKKYLNAKQKEEVTEGKKRVRKSSPLPKNKDTTSDFLKFVVWFFLIYFLAIKFLLPYHNDFIEAQKDKTNKSMRHKD
jgi:hypothetical protein